jgi:uncharacterized protein with GYD domain
MVVASYSAEGIKGVLREGGSKRRETVAEMVSNLGGKLEAFYYAFGHDDVYSIVDLPDNATAAAFALHIAASGTIDVRVVVLLTPQDIDEAAKMKMWFRPPGA